MDKSYIEHKIKYLNRKRDILFFQIDEHFDMDVINSMENIECRIFDEKYLGDYTDKRYLYDLLHSRNYALHKQPVLLKQQIENTKNEVVAKWQQEIIIPDIVLEGKEEIQVSADKFLLEKSIFANAWFSCDISLSAR